MILIELALLNEVLCGIEIGILIKISLLKLSTLIQIALHLAVIFRFFVLFTAFYGSISIALDFRNTNTEKLFYFIFLSHNQIVYLVFIQLHVKLAQNFIVQSEPICFLLLLIIARRIIMQGNQSGMEMVNDLS